MELGFQVVCNGRGSGLAERKTSDSGAMRVDIRKNGTQLYTPWRLKLRKKEMSGFFRDHYLSGFSGVRPIAGWGAQAAAEDLHRQNPGDRRSRPGGQDCHGELDSGWRKCVGILSRETAREFLRRFYGVSRRIRKIRALLTASEAMEVVKDQPAIEKNLSGVMDQREL